MISVKIGTAERRLEEVDESWANREINRQRAHGESVCVRVRIDTPAIKVMFTTPGCAGNGATRPPNEVERRVLDLLTRNRLNTTEFTGGNLVAFLHQVGRIL